MTGRYDLEIRLVLAALGALWMLWVWVRLGRWGWLRWPVRLLALGLGLSQAGLLLLWWDPQTEVMTPSLLRIGSVFWHAVLVPIGLVCLLVSGVAGIGRKGVVYVDNPKPPSTEPERPIPLAEQEGPSPEIRQLNENPVARRPRRGYPDMDM